ncbi:MAG: hypothetical protein WC708_13820 [Lentisphaeria bacterium]
MNQREPDSVKVAEELFAHEELTSGAPPAGTVADDNPKHTAVRQELLDLDQALKVAVPALPGPEKEQAFLDRVMAATADARAELRAKAAAETRHRFKLLAWLSAPLAAAACFCFLFFAPTATKEQPILIINALGDGAMRGGPDDWASACGQAVQEELSQHRPGVTLTQAPAGQLSLADLAKRNPQSAVLLMLEPGAADNTLSVKVYDTRSNRILQQKILAVTPQDWRTVSREINAVVKQALPDR